MRVCVVVVVIAVVAVVFDVVEVDVFLWCQSNNRSRLVEQALSLSLSLPPRGHNLVCNLKHPESSSLPVFNRFHDFFWFYFKKDISAGTRPYHSIQQRPDNVQSVLYRNTLSEQGSIKYGTIREQGIV